MQSMRGAASVQGHVSLPWQRAGGVAILRRYLERSERKWGAYIDRPLAWSAATALTLPGTSIAA
jgi:hypothetical protein